MAPMNATIANRELEESQVDDPRSFRVKRVQIPSPEWDATATAIRRAMSLTAELNRLSIDDAAKIREIFFALTGQEPDEAFTLIPPFYTSGGLDIRVGRKVIINQCCTIYDMGGVDIGDRVMIGPNVNIITAGHPLSPSKRRAYVEAKPIVIEKNVWIAAGVTIIGGVSVGENSVIGAGSVVTRDVPANAFVAGAPCKVIRSLEESFEA
jgi:acetyltransferase-like isoleucine patch superfamily enzyme